MNIETYYRAKTLPEAYEVLVASTDNAILGGGAWMKLSTKSVGKLISLDDLELSKILVADGHVEIGAMATLREIETDETIRNLCGGALSDAARQIMGIGVRNIATIGGSVVSKFGFSDLIPVLLAMDAKLVFFHHGEISIKTFLESKIVGRDILTKIRIKENPRPFFFKKVKTTSLDFAILNVCVGIGEEGLRIAVGSRPGVAMLAEKAMDFLNGIQHPFDADIEKAADIAVDELHFSTNARAHEEYRKQLANVYVRRGLKEVLKG